jgi:hypothetical protein
MRSVSYGCSVAPYAPVVFRSRRSKLKHQRRNSTFTSHNVPREPTINMDAEMKRKSPLAQCFKVAQYSPFPSSSEESGHFDSKEKHGEKYRTDQWVHHKVEIEMIAN